MEVKNEIKMKFSELKHFINVVEYTHFQGLEYSHITNEFNRLIKQVEDCIYLDKGELND
jgi:hypothetical protein